MTSQRTARIAIAVVAQKPLTPLLARLSFPSVNEPSASGGRARDEWRSTPARFAHFLARTAQPT